MNELPPDARALLDAARRADDPTPGDRARIDSAMQQTLAAHGVPLLVAGASSTAPVAAAGGSPTLSAGGAATAAAGGLQAKLMGALLVGALGAAGAFSAYVAFDADVEAPEQASAAFRRSPSGRAAQVSGPRMQPLTGEVAPPAGSDESTAQNAQGPEAAQAKALANPTTLEPVPLERTQALPASVESAASHGVARDPEPRSTVSTWEKRRARRQRSGRAANVSRHPAPTRRADPTPAPVLEAPVTTAAPFDASPQEPQTAQLREEMDLLGRARRELSGGDPLRALEILGQHAGRFGHGRLWQERQGLEVLALCDAGRVAEGRRLRAALLARAPNAIMAARVRRACSTPERLEPLP